MVKVVEFKLNHKPVRLKIDEGRKLLWVLRGDLALTGTKYGCGKGICGACTVLIDGEAVRSCQVPVGEVNEKEVITIEGLAPDGRLHPLQKAFMEHNAVQCGYCTPGMILNALSLLREKPGPTEAEIIQAMNGNLCRCGAHQRIVRAIQAAAREMRGSK